MDAITELIDWAKNNGAGHISTYDRKTKMLMKDCIIIHKDCPLYHNVDVMVKNYRLQEENKKDVE